MEAKKRAADKAVEQIRDGMIVGLGTGSTATYAIQRIGERVKQGLRIEAIPTSARSEQLAMDLGIPLRSFAGLSMIDITIDGADQVDKDRNLIKGGGGSLLREKIVAVNSKVFYVIIDESKLVEALTFPLPVEVISFGHELALKRLEAFGCVAAIRQAGGQNFITDNGHLIADCRFSSPITNPKALNAGLKEIPGVAETGLFPHNLVGAVFVGYHSGEVKMI